MNVSAATKSLYCCLQLLDQASDLVDAWQFQQSKRWLNRRWLRHPINEKRLFNGFFATQFQEIKQDNELLFQYLRMDVSTFNYLLSRIDPYLRNRRKRQDFISAEQQLAITLRYLVTGDDILSIALSYRLGRSTVYGIILRTCSAIFQVLSPIYLRPPTASVWRNIRKGFEENWQLPGCIGAVDGKHIRIQCPKESGALFYNYKKYHSIVLLAACNHRYEFTLVEVGAFGSESDGGIFSRSEFGKSLDEGRLNIPTESVKLQNTHVKLPYFFVGDEAFRMTTSMMRPYPGRHLDKKKRIFNYRLSRARRCIENAFGILVSRWRVFSKPIAFSLNNVDEIIMATVCLHNFVMARTQKEVRNMYCPSGYTDEENSHGNIVNGSWRTEIQIDNAVRAVNSSEEIKEAHNMRNLLADYFNSPEGEVPWQEEYINRGRFQDVSN